MTYKFKVILDDEALFFYNTIASLTNEPMEEILSTTLHQFAVSVMRDVCDSRSGKDKPWE